MLLDNRINKLYNILKNKNLDNIKNIMIRCTKNEIMVKIIGSNINKNQFKDISVTSLYINNELFLGKEYITDEINNFKFSIYPDSFYQVNTECMNIIYNETKNYLSSSDKLLDLYCGIGTIGIWLSNNFNHIKGIEINEYSIKNANINKKINNIKNINFVCNDAKNAGENYDAIVVDPPRNGLSKNVINYLNSSKTNKIVYISCNPMTLKRDINLLNNYKIINLKFFEMFPKTSHVECVILLQRKD